MYRAISLRFLTGSLLYIKDNETSTLVADVDMEHISGVQYNNHASMSPASKICYMLMKFLKFQGNARGSGTSVFWNFAAALSMPRWLCVANLQVKVFDCVISPVSSHNGRELF